MSKVLNKSSNPSSSKHIRKTHSLINQKDGETKPALHSFGTAKVITESDPYMRLEQKIRKFKKFLSRRKIITIELIQSS